MKKYFYSNDCDMELSHHNLDQESKGVGRFDSIESTRMHSLSRGYQMKTNPSLKSKLPGSIRIQTKAIQIVHADQNVLSTAPIGSTRLGTGGDGPLGGLNNSLVSTKICFNKYFRTSELNSQTVPSCHEKILLSTRVFQPCQERGSSKPELWR